MSSFLKKVVMFSNQIFSFLKKVFMFSNQIASLLKKYKLTQCLKEGGIGILKLLVVLFSISNENGAYYENGAYFFSF
jgi:hypothetical protein